MRKFLFWAGLGVVFIFMFGCYTIIDHKINPPPQHSHSPPQVVVIDPAKVLETIRNADFAFTTKKIMVSAVVKSCHKSDDSWGEYLKYGFNYSTGQCKDVTVKAKFEVKGYFDFKKTPPIVNQKADVLYVDLGSPLVDQIVRLDKDSYKVEAAGGIMLDLFGDGGRGLERSAWPSMNLNARKEACQSGLLNNARADAEQFFTKLLAAKHVSKVVVKTSPGIC